MELDSTLMNIIAVLAIVGGLAMSVWWAIAVVKVRSRNDERGLPGVEYPDDLREVNAGIPPALVVFYVSIVAVMISYVLYIWLGGVRY